MGDRHELARAAQASALEVGEELGRRPPTTPGSRKSAVPIPTSVAPAARNSLASAAPATPPIPMIGRPVAARAW